MALAATEGRDKDGGEVLTVTVSSPVESSSDTKATSGSGGRSGDSGGGCLRAVFDMKRGCLSRLQLLGSGDGEGSDGGYGAVDLLQAVHDGDEGDDEVRESPEVCLLGLDRFLSLVERPWKFLTL